MFGLSLSNDRIAIGVGIILLIAVAFWWTRPKDKTAQSCSRACARAEAVSQAIAKSDDDEAAARLLGPLATGCRDRCMTEHWSGDARQCFESANDVDEVRRCRRLAGHAASP